MDCALSRGFSKAGMDKSGIFDSLVVFFSDLRYRGT